MQRAGQSFLPELAAVEVLSPLVTRVMGLNPSAHTLQGTCTYLVGRGKKRILIDTGEGRAGYVPLIKEALKNAGADGVELVLITHHHFDHVGGLADLLREYGASLPTFKRVEGCHSGVGLRNAMQHLEDGATFRTEGATLRAIYTPGHTDDHVSFWLEEEQALFSGDCILGHGTTVFDDLGSYMATLKKLLKIANGEEGGYGVIGSMSGEPALQVIYPGHGAPITSDPVGVIKVYISHRNMREEQIVRALAEGDPGGMTSFQITQSIYRSLSPMLLMSAQWNLEQHLSKLEDEGVIKRQGLMARWTLCSEKKKH